ncbi:MAG TPA: class I SAM-dependent methyltransferase, partial [Patescibacteria group bacterium]
MSKYKGTTTLEVLKDAHHYNNWIASNFIRKIEEPIIEIGSGTGNLSTFFTHHGIHLTDVDYDLVQKLKKRFGKKGISVSQLNVSHAISSKQKGKYRSVLSINVLEHIENDERALVHMNQLLKKNGKLLL